MSPVADTGSLKNHSPPGESRMVQEAAPQEMGGGAAGSRLRERVVSLET